MFRRSATRLFWSLLWFSPSVVYAALPAAPTAVPVFLDSLESGDNCRWSSAVPPEPDTCSDLAWNGCETDIDCGGRSCPACSLGLACLQDSDCLSGICNQGACDIGYTLTVTHTGGGRVTSSPAGIDCGATCSALFDAETLVTLTATPDGDAIFLGWSGLCPMGPTCSVLVSQAASVAAHFGHSVTITRNGTGTVTSTPAGITCGATCSGTFEHGTTVTLAARTTNGSGWYFSGWAGDCAAAGPFHDCSLNVGAPQSVTANFSSRTWNLAFVSSTLISPTLGSVEAYDTQCNLLASAAGINNVIGTQYVAWISSTASNAVSRLGGARGWVKMDGTPFADTPSALVTENQVFQPLDLDETGARRTWEVVMTGTWHNGTVEDQNNCNDWTPRFSDFVAVGSTAAGPVRWSLSYYRRCDQPYRIYCLGTTRTVALSAPVTTGKRIWLSNSPYIPDPATTPDEACAVDQPGARALVATTTVPASTVIDPGSTYVAMNGQLVGTGAELLAAGRLQSGIWQYHDGTYLDYNEVTAWTGSQQGSDLTGLGTWEGTCHDWTSHVGGRGRYSEPAFIDRLWWNGWNGICSAWTKHLICVEP